MWKWVAAYVSCVVFWIACDLALLRSDSYVFSSFMRLPLVTAFDLAGCYSWCAYMLHSPFLSIGTLVATAYAALGFLPLILAPLFKRWWLLCLTGAFLLAHPGLWLLIFMIGPHP